MNGFNEGVTSRYCTAADLIVSFVNTRPSIGGRVEMLGSAAGLHGWLSRDDWPGEVPLVTAADAAAAMELREAFVSIFRSHVGCTEAEAGTVSAVDYLQRTAERYPLVAKFTVDGYVLVPSQDGLGGVFGHLLAAAAAVADRGDWARLKICKNTSCFGGFVDKTKNLSGAYCSSACSSQMSMRVYRSRTRQPSARP